MSGTSRVNAPRYENLVERVILARGASLVRVVTNKTFGDFFLSRPCAALYFWAGWDNGDGYMKHRLSVLSRRYPEVAFGVLNVDVEENWTIAKVFGIETVPTILFFCQGSKKGDVEGPISLTSLAKLVRHYRNKAQRIEDIRMRMLDRETMDDIPF